MVAALALPGPVAAEARHAPDDAGCDRDPLCLAAAFAETMSASDGRLELDRLVTFEPGRIRVYSESREKLARLATVWRDSVGWAEITVHGYADAGGRTSAANLALAQRRADKIRGYLIRYGVDPAYITAVGLPGAEADGPGAARHVDLAITRCTRSSGTCLPGAAQASRTR